MLYGRRGKYVLLYFVILRLCKGFSNAMMSDSTFTASTKKYGWQICSKCSRIMEPLWKEANIKPWKKGRYCHPTIHFCSWLSHCLGWYWRYNRVNHYKEKWEKNGMRQREISSLNCAQKRLSQYQKKNIAPRITVELPLELKHIQYLSNKAAWNIGICLLDLLMCV